MDLLKSYFRQIGTLVDEKVIGGRVFFADFGHLEFEKYYNLSQGESGKRIWFFRLDFLSGHHTARYLFFFARASSSMRDQSAVVIHVAREERPYWYERLENITASHVPSLLEIGYSLSEENFIARYRDGVIGPDTIEHICRNFIEEVVGIHF